MMELSLKEERQLWACNAWAIAQSGNLYQFNDRFGVCLNVHQRKGGGWGIGVINLTPKPKWGPTYDNQALAVWHSFEWLHSAFPVQYDDDLYIKYKLLDNIVSSRRKLRTHDDGPTHKFGVLSGGVFTLTTDRTSTGFGATVREHQKIIQLCEVESPVYIEHQQRLHPPPSAGQWRPMPPKVIHDPADKVVDNPNDFEELVGSPDLEIRPANDVVEHTKTYTEEAPLFGRLVGTFKWRKHPRRERRS